MADINKVILVGSVVLDPEIRIAKDGSPKVEILLSTSTSLHHREGEDIKEFHRIVLTNQLAETAGEYLVKDLKVQVEGQLRSVIEVSDGDKHYTTQIMADEIKIIDAVVFEEDDDSSCTFPF